MKGLARWGMFATLCVLASAVWMVEDRWPQVQVTLATDAVACGLVAVLTAAWAWRGRHRNRREWRALGIAAVGGAMVLVGPSVGSLMGVPMLNAGGLAMVVLVRMTAGQYAARFAVAPLLTLVQGVVLLHSEVTWRIAVCAVLLVAASVALLRRDADGETAVEKVL